MTLSDYAAIVSAGGGMIAALAAGISAWSAHSANQQAREAERRTALRQIAAMADEIVHLSQRIEKRANEMSQAYQTLAIFSTGMGGSFLKHYETEAQNKYVAATQIAEDARSYIGALTSLSKASAQAHDAAHLFVTRKLTEIRAILAELDREYGEIEAQNRIYREKAIKGPQTT